MDGLSLKGYFCGCTDKEFIDDDGNKKISHSVLISSGSDFFKVKTEKSFQGLHLFGDEVTFSVRPRVYNGNVYWSGSEEV